MLQLSARINKVESVGNTGRSDSGSGSMGGVGWDNRGAELTELEIATLRRQVTATTQVSRGSSLVQLLLNDIEPQKMTGDIAAPSSKLNF